jgi:hypothetical protein
LQRGRSLHQPAPFLCEKQLPELPQ